jgi:hypothetical protein
MAQNIILKRSGLAGKVPDTGSLNLGEVAINTYDGRLFFKKSGSVEVIEHILTTNSTTTGSITLTKTGSFGELVVTQDGNIQRDLYVTRDIITNGDLDVSGSVSGSSARIEGTGSFQSLKVNDTLTVNHGETVISGSQLVTSDLTVLGSVNARQFNISVISSSVIYQSGSTKFGDTQDDIHSFTGSVNVTGSLYINGAQVTPGGTSANTFDFNAEVSAGKIGYISDESDTTKVIPKTNSIDIQIAGTTYLSMSTNTMNITTGSITANYMHLAKYINNDGDLDFNV